MGHPKLFDSLADVAEKIDEVLATDPEIEDRQFLKDIRGELQTRLKDTYGEAQLKRISAGEFDNVFGICVCKCHSDDTIEHDSSSFCIYCKCLDENWGLEQ